MTNGRCIILAVVALFLLIGGQEAGKNAPLPIWMNVLAAGSFVAGAIWGLICCIKLRRMKGEKKENGAMQRHVRTTYCSSKH